MKDNSAPLVSVIVPVFNEEENIGMTLERILQLDGRLNLEVIVVDDGSTDQTREIVKKFEDVNLICHEKNCGKGGAIVTGMVSSRGDIIVIQDADLEYLPEEIPKLIDPILQGKADFVFGSRFLGTIRGMSRSHRVGNMILSVAARLLYNTSITDVMTGHKAFSRRSLKTVKLSERGFGIEVELTAGFLGNGWKLAEVPISYVYRNKGRSKIAYTDGLMCLVKLVKLRISPSAR